MTEKTDEMVEENLIPVSASLPQNAFDDEGDDEFSDEHDEKGPETEAMDGELTPNDIFGLDPLDVLTLEELAEYLKVSPAAARRVIKEQNLPGRNIGGEWRFLRDAVANWLRGQEPVVQQQQKARTDFAKPPAVAPQEDNREQFSRPPRRPFQADQSGGGEYRPRQRFPEEGQQFGGQGAGQYGQRGGQYGGNQYGSGQYGGGQGGGGNQFRGANQNAGGGSYTQPPRRPFRAAEPGSEGGYKGGNQSAGYAAGAGGYAGGDRGNRFGGGGNAGGEQRFTGGPKRKNKRQVFDNERGKRLDRRRDGETPDVPQTPE